tara:strand:- start:9120 stop:9974 length:855 start_codon:yes stop_codon:yes gene_type:complete
MIFLPQDVYVKINYEYYSGRKLDYNNPVTFNDKIQWLKVFYHREILHQLVDKYAVRDYVKEKVGSQYLNELYAVYNKPAEVDFEKLPNQFVLKGVHGFHLNLIVKDKNKLNLKKTNYLLNKWMLKDHYRNGKEWAYKNVKPRIIAEKYLEEFGKDVVNDYKFFCFNGKPKFIQIDMERGTEDLRCYYDLDWKKLPFTTEKNKFFEGELQMPEHFNEMIDVAQKLSKDFPFVRVDLYNINGKILFGEMTFYPTDGRKKYIPNEYNKIIGDYLELPKIPEGQKVIT